MTNGQGSILTTIDRRFWPQKEPGVDIDAIDMLRVLFEHLSTATILSQDSVSDCQTLGMYGQDDQTSTHDVKADTAHHTHAGESSHITYLPNRGAARQTHQIKDNHNMLFLGVRGLTYDMVAEQRRRDVKAITSMGADEVINRLAARGLADAAERLTYLYDVTEEDEEDIKLNSLRGFAILMIKNRDMHPPQITVTDDGLIQAVWKHTRQGTLVMDFQESGDVEFTLLYGWWDQGTKRRKLSGELPPDQAMSHVGDFVRDVMRT